MGDVVRPLTERQQKILIRVVELFNETGHPVGSTTLARQEGIGVSSATIRNAMSEMEEMGLLCQPHTSAGRMPTWTGVRCYVDHLVETKRTNTEIDIDWRRHLGAVDDHNLETVVRSTGTIISRLSKLTTIVSSPEVTEVRLKDVHLSQLSGRRILVVLVTEDGRVFNRAVQLEEEVDEESLRRMRNFLSEQVVGLSLEQVRRRVRKRLAEAEHQYRKFMRRALEIGREVVEMATRSELFIEGSLHMLEVSELTSDVERARDVLRTLEDGELLLEVLDRICETSRAKALIGPELGKEWGDGLSLVACGYYHDGRQVGLLGILGPMRMDYARVIPLVEHAADVLSKELDTIA